MNHLFVGKDKPPSASARNRLVTQGPRISQHASHHNNPSSILSKQLQAVANAQAVSKSQRMRSSRMSNSKHAVPDQPPKSGNASTSKNTTNTETATASSSSSKSGDVCPVVKEELKEKETDKTPQASTNTCNNGPTPKDSISSSGVQNAVCVDSQDKKTPCVLTSDLIIMKDKGEETLSEVREPSTIPVLTMESGGDDSQSSNIPKSGAENGPDSIAPSTISDKCVQTSFEGPVHLDEVQHDAEHENSSSISRDCPTATTAVVVVPIIPPSAVSEVRTGGPNDGGLEESLLFHTTHTQNSVPYTSDDDVFTTPSIQIYDINNTGNRASSSFQSTSGEQPHRGGCVDDIHNIHVNSISTNLHNNNNNIPSDLIQTLNLNPQSQDDDLHTATTNNPPEDSGIDSSSTASPSTTPKRRPKTTTTTTTTTTNRSESLDDGIIVTSQDDMACQRGDKNDEIVHVSDSTTTTRLSNQIEISKSDQDLGDVSVSTTSSNTVTGLCIDTKGLVHGTQDVNDTTTTSTITTANSPVSSGRNPDCKIPCDKTDIGSSEDNNSTNNMDRPLDLDLSSATTSTTTTTTKHSNSISTNHPDASSNPRDLPPSPETFSLSDMVTATSPQRKYFHRSVSCTVSSPGLIETVPIPENLTGSEPYHNPQAVITGSSAHQHSGELSNNTRSSNSSKITGQSSTSSSSSGKDTTNTKPTSTTSTTTTSTTTTTNSNTSKPTLVKTRANTLPPAYSRRMSSPASCHLTNDPNSSKKPFNPFPVKLFNANRAKTGLKLGLYSATTLEQLKGLKTRTTST